MGHAVGVLAMEHIAAGLVEGDRIVGPIRTYPDQADEGSSVLPTLPPAEIVQAIGRLIDDVAHGYPLDVVGVGFPGAIATGIAATRGQLDTLTRVWTLGSGVGFGRYPHAPGIWEGGHVVVSLDPKESLCGCGGQGHLEGIVGHRSMRLRFLDLEPEEVFAQAAGGDARCAAFVRLWHRALAAAAAGSIHMDGPGRFFLSGPNARFVDTAVLAGALHDMVKMSPLQGSAFEVVARSDDLAIIGAAVGARQSAA
jgi:glucokinase